MKRAQVYIATTKGLVQVQSIHALSDPDLHSVVSINNTSTLAKISADYQSFVQKPQGLIHELFGCHAYRVNIASQIDQGNSWQLAIFLAHALAVSSKNMLFTGVENTIFIATGRIDTVNHKVLSVEGLPQKCIAANAQISAWQAQGHAVHFFVPHGNLRQPLPDTSINLTPVQSLTQIIDFLLNESFLKDSIDLNKSVSNSSDVMNDVESSPKPNKNLSATVNLERIDSGDINHIESIKTQTGKHDKTLPIDQDNISFIQQLPKTIKTKVLLVVCSVVFVAIYFLFGESRTQHKIDQFSLVSHVSENRQLCSLTANKPIIYTGQLGQTSSINALNLQHLCSLSLKTYTDFAQVWLVSESSAIVPLFGQVSLPEDNKNNEGYSVTWGIPLPSENIIRQYYHILLFPNKVDAADKQSLQYYLLFIQSQQSQHSTQDIVSWSHTQNTPVFIIKNELYQP
ncbi:hypothetical protein [Glaciecola petra]|uniref:Uncharacterized protein n=1 Tax=Glaciecola petra TaxID=3075602 RepID=A0ABU2ZP59_9ALTE|nr:hypothetical protein [Aestuariibacter sp. P117]MDT0594056.1 hypothetical protein [Aestuariibacter sp. P117]